MRTMASLSGLPHLPESLRGLLQAGNAHWKETEKIIQLKTSIQSDLESENVEDRTAPSEYKPSSPTSSTPESPSTNFSNLESAIAFLRHEMTNLRQTDVSLLCQLWTLSENIQEYKQNMNERFSETNSTCSSHSLDNGIESLDAIEENGFESSLLASASGISKESEENMYENGHFHRRSVNLNNHFDRIRTPEVKPVEIAPLKESSMSGEDYEPMYLEPVPSLYKEIVIPIKRPNQTNGSQASSSQKNKWTSYPYPGNTTYESSC